MNTKPLLAAALLGLACACSSTPPAKKEPNVNLAGYPPAFREGYLQGCDSARRHTARKDEIRYKADAQYAAGWRDGFDICGKQAR
jgi:hypothetical protein